jgi:hypothetical protein
MKMMKKKNSTIGCILAIDLRKCKSVGCVYPTTRPPAASKAVSA